MMKWVYRLGLPTLLLAGLLVGLLAVSQSWAAPRQTNLPISAFNTVRMESDSFGLHWHVYASGGEPVASTNYQLHSTLGQPVTGNMDSPSFTHRAGYWQEWLYRLFLPFLEK